MANDHCGKCGASWPRGDQSAALAHKLRCSKSVLRNGLYLGKKHEAKKVKK